MKSVDEIIMEMGQLISGLEAIRITYEATGQVERAAVVAEKVKSVEDCIRIAEGG